MTRKVKMAAAESWNTVRTCIHEKWSVSYGYNETITLPDQASTSQEKERRVDSLCVVSLYMYV